MNPYESAFPCPPATGEYAPQGLTKREYVVIEMAKALVNSNTTLDPYSIAGRALNLADAVLGTT